MKTGKRKSCDCDDPSVPHYPEDHLITPKPTGEWTLVTLLRECRSYFIANKNMRNRIDTLLATVKDGK